MSSSVNLWSKAFKLSLATLSFNLILNALYLIVNLWRPLQSFSGTITIGCMMKTILSVSKDKRAKTERKLDTRVQEAQDFTDQGFRNINSTESSGSGRLLQKATDEESEDQPVFPISYLEGGGPAKSKLSRYSFIINQTSFFTLLIVTYEVELQFRSVSTTLLQLDRGRLPPARLKIQHKKKAANKP